MSANMGGGDSQRWIANRMQGIESSGIRKAFEMAKGMVDPIDLSIGLPDFDVAEPAKTAAIEAIRSKRNSYTLTQGLPELRQKIEARVKQDLGHDRQAMITAGTGGALTLAINATVNPGEEVIVFDPYFIMYGNLVALAGGRTVLIDTYPRFRIDPDQVAAVINSRTKAVIVNSPCNPTGAVATREEMRGLAELCQRCGVLLISDEVYRSFCHNDDQPFASPAQFNEETLVIDGFSKSHAMTGWRLGFAHGPAPLLQEMAKIQQFSFICAPSLVQYAGIAALDVDLSDQQAIYRRRRDRVIQALDGLYELTSPDGAFYAYPKAPWGTATEFVAEAIRNKLLIIPGNVFSKRDTHFRLSYAVDDAVLDRGLEVLKRIARRG